MTVWQLILFMVLLGLFGTICLVLAISVINHWHPGCGRTFWLNKPVKDLDQF